MRFIYAIIDYFVRSMIYLTLSLVIFAFPAARRLLYKLKTRFKDFFQHQIVKYAIYLAFILILLILFESILTFSTMNTYFRKRSKYHPDAIGIDQLDDIPHNNRQNYMIQLRQYREYYMAERNIMLASTALFIFFAFHQIFYNILKYAETEHRVALLSQSASIQKLVINRK